MRSMSSTMLKKIYQFKVKEYGNNTKLYGITAALLTGIANLTKNLETPMEQFKEQIDNYNGTIVNDDMLFTNRRDAELFIEWLDSLITIKVLKGD